MQDSPGLTQQLLMEPGAFSFLFFLFQHGTLFSWLQEALLYPRGKSTGAKTSAR